MNQPDTITSEVARLRAENARLRAALEKIAAPHDDAMHSDHCVEHRRIARAVLSRKAKP